MIKRILIFLITCTICLCAKSEFPDEIEFDSRILGVWLSKVDKYGNQTKYKFKEDRTAVITYYHNMRSNSMKYRYYYFTQINGKKTLQFVLENSIGGRGLFPVFYEGDSVFLDQKYYKVK
jgi:hypothetical protein